MGLRKKRKQQPAAKAVNPAPAADPMLPGTAGYRNATLRDKNSMPESRFRYVRPDGKP